MDFDEFKKQHPEIAERPGLYKIQPHFLDGSNIYKIGMGSKLFNRFRDYHTIYWPAMEGTTKSFKIYEALVVPRKDDRFIFSGVKENIARESDIKRAMVKLGINYKPIDESTMYGDWKYEPVKKSGKIIPRVYGEWVKEQEDKKISLRDFMRWNDTFYDCTQRTKDGKCVKIMKEGRYVPQPKARRTTRLNKKQKEAMFQDNLKLDVDKTNIIDEPRRRK